jgi:Arc/MetJ family transcription regulator
MRTTLEVPEELMEKAKKILGFKSKTDVIVYSLRELVRRHELEKLKGLSGKINLSVDLDKSRRRRAKPLS